MNLAYVPVSLLNGFRCSLPCSIAFSKPMIVSFLLYFIIKSFLIGTNTITFSLIHFLSFGEFRRFVFKPFHVWTHYLTPFRSAFVFFLASFSTFNWLSSLAIILVTFENSVLGFLLLLFFPIVFILLYLSTLLLFYHFLHLQNIYILTVEDNYNHPCVPTSNTHTSLVH